MSKQKVMNIKTKLKQKTKMRVDLSYSSTLFTMNFYIYQFSMLCSVLEIFYLHIDYKKHKFLFFSMKILNMLK